MLGGAWLLRQRQRLLRSHLCGSFELLCCSFVLLVQQLLQERLRPSEPCSLLQAQVLRSFVLRSHLCCPGRLLQRRWQRLLRSDLCRSVGLL